MPTEKITPDAEVEIDKPGLGTLTGTVLATPPVQTDMAELIVEVQVPDMEAATIVGGADEDERNVTTEIHSVPIFNTRLIKHTNSPAPEDEPQQAVA